MSVRPVLPAMATVAFPYLDSRCIALASGGWSDHFTSDNDVFNLDERLLKLGMIWQWKANKGSPYAEDMANYMTALARVSGADKPSPIIIDRLPISGLVHAAYPFSTPSAAAWGWPLS